MISAVFVSDKLSKPQTWPGSYFVFGLVSSLLRFKQMPKDAIHCELNFEKHADATQCNSKSQKAPRGTLCTCPLMLRTNNLAITSHTQFDSFVKQKHIVSFKKKSSTPHNYAKELQTKLRKNWLLSTASQFSTRELQQYCLLLLIKKKKYFAVQQYSGNMTK